MFEVSTNPDRLIAMEGVRGLAILLVLLVHLHSAFSQWLAPASFLFKVSEVSWVIGQTGVDLFFVLSGYLIYGATLKGRQGYGQFLKRRVQRIYPVFTCVFILYVLLSFALPERSRIPAGAYESIIYLLQNFLLLPGLLPIEPMVTVTWSLSFEFVFYLTIPLLTRGLSLQRRSYLPRVLFFVFLSLLTIAMSAAFTAGTNHGRVTLFFGGIIIYELLQSRNFREKLSQPQEVTLLLFLPVILGLYYFVNPVISAWEISEQLRGALRQTANITLLMAAWPPFVCFCLGRKGILSRCFSWTPLRWLGNISYSFYLIHSLSIHAVQLLLSKLLPPQPHQPLIWFTALLPAGIAAIGASLVLFLLVEKPFSLKAERRKSGEMARARPSPTDSLKV